MRLVVFILAAAAALLGQEHEAAEAREKGAIKVHGHWVMEVKNPDGSTASRKEFENSLSTGANNGNNLLTLLLTGGLTPANWEVTIGGGPAAPNAVYILSPNCLLVQGTTCFPNLTVTVSNRQIVLQGTTSAMTISFPISVVQTAMNDCSPNVSPSGCIAGTTFNGAFGFTQASVTGLTVQVGQMIAVTVTISFS